MKGNPKDGAAQPSVLLVDDTEANLVALEAQLSTMGCELVRAASGNDALRQLLKREFAVMLLDVQMPEMDGYEVARYARENPQTKDVPIIFVTAMHETEENLRRGYEAGAVDFLFKPVNPHVLRAKVQVFLELYSGRRRLADEIEARTRASAELEAFNYSVSHDLRAPLRPLEGFSRVLLEDYGEKLDDKGRDYLRRIRDAAQRMSHLIDDLLELSRMSRAEMVVRPMDLASVANAVMTEIRQTDPARAVDYVSASEAPMNGDPRLLRIALENLLRNAWKFTQKVPHARIEFGVSRDGGECTYFVRDNGAGFDPRRAAGLFKPFQRLHSTSEFEGTGIGLAIVDRIVRRHEGRIWAQSSPGAGATFLFTLEGK